MPKPVIDHENFYKAIFQQASEGILLDDGQGNYIEANPEACSMLGYTRDELLNLRVYDIITQESQREDPLHWEQLRRQQTIRLTRSFRRKDGQVIVCDMSARGLNDGTILVILRDVTQSFQTEKELELYTANLTPPAGKKVFSRDSATSLSFHDVFDVAEIQKIQDAFADAVGVASLITAPDGSPLTQPSNFCRFCHMVRNTGSGALSCQNSDFHLGNLSREKGLAYQKCLSTGMTDACATIYAGDRVIALWLIGQVFIGSEDRESILLNAVDHGLEAGEAAAALSEVKTIPAERFERAIEALRLIASQLSVAALHNLQLAKYLAERRVTARKMASSIRLLHRRQNALSEMLAYPGDRVFDLGELVKIITRASAEALEVDYVSVWLGNDTEGQLTCIDRFHRGKDTHTKGETLFMKQFPTYFNALTTHRVIDASDVMTDERVAEFVKLGYVSRFGVSSMLDATILINGRLAGVICVEHTGDKRNWNSDEQNFIADVADKVAMGLLTMQRAQTENDLRESEMRFRQMFQSNNVVMMLIDPDSGYLLDANPAALNFYGYSRIEMLNMNISQINTMSVADIYTAMQKTRNSRQNYFIFNHRLKSGEIKTVEVYGSTITLQGKDIIYSIVHDITDRRLMEIENRKLSLAVEQSPLSIVITDADGRIEYVNRQFEEITGYTASEALGKNPSVLKSGLTPDQVYEDLWKTIKMGRIWRGEFINRKKDGSLYTESVIIAPIAATGKEVYHFLALKEDITVKKQMEDDLRKAKERAEESDKLKTAFLNNMSHEIRTPMNAIAGFADLLRDDDLTRDEQLKYIEIINSNTDQLLGIVNDVLEISRLDSGRIPLHLSRFYLNHLMEDIYQSFLPEVSRRNLKFSYTCGLPYDDSFFETDREKLRQVIIGFISNALKFTDKGEISFGYKTIADQVVFYVRDTGIGIAEADQQKVFDRFYQVAQPEGKSKGGTGLGLSIAAGISKLLEGTLDVQSIPGEGSTFSLAVKNSRVHQSIREERNNNLEQLQQLVVLVAEDEVYNFEFLKALLDKHVAAIHHAFNGQQAVEMAAALSPDIILMDLKMPVMDGVEATRLIKAANPAQVVIAQTAYSQPEELNKLSAAGCSLCLTKPIKRSDLLEAILKFA